MAYGDVVDLSREFAPIDAGYCLRMQLSLKLHTHTHPYTDIGEGDVRARGGVADFAQGKQTYVRASVTYITQ